MVCFVVSLCALTTLAQAEEQKAQLYLVYEVTVNPSKANDYEAAIKEYFSLFAEGKSSYPWYASSSDDFHYYFVSPIENFAEIDKMNISFAELMTQVGMERWQALANRLNDNSEYYRQFMTYHRLDLSYVPKNPRLKPEEEKYIQWDFWNILQGKEGECEELLKKWVALCESKNSPHAYGVIVGDIGTKMPLIIITQTGKDSVDWHIHNQEMWKLLGEEGSALMDKWMTLIKKYDRKTGWLRPDLSYMPKEK